MSLLAAAVGAGEAAGQRLGAAAGMLWQLQQHRGLHASAAQQLADFQLGTVRAESFYDSTVEKVGGCGSAQHNKTQEQPAARLAGMEDVAAMHPRLCRTA